MRRAGFDPGRGSGRELRSACRSERRSRAVWLRRIRCERLQFEFAGRHRRSRARWHGITVPAAIELGLAERAALSRGRRPKTANVTIHSKLWTEVVALLQLHTQ